MATKGLSGLIYWYAMYPFHGAIFGNMARMIAERAEERACQRSSPGSAERLQETDARGGSRLGA